MRQVGTGSESRTTLIVHKQEGKAVRRNRLGHTQHPGLKEFTLTGTGGTTHQGVGTVHAQIQCQGRVSPLPHQGGEGDRPVHGHRLGAVNDGVSGLPTGHLGGGVVGQFSAGKRDETNRTRQVGVIIHGHTRIHHGRHVLS